MANEGKKQLVTKDMTTLKIRMYTDIPPNTVLVGRNIFTKKPKIYKAAFLHMPWFESKFVSMLDHHRELGEMKYQMGGTEKGYDLITSVAITYRVKPFDTTMKMGFKERWMSVLSKFSGGEVSSYLKAGLLAAGTIAAGIFVGPLAAVAIPAITAGYISAFHQDQKWVEEQGAYKAVYKQKDVMQQIENKIKAALNLYYGNHSYDEIRTQKFDLSHPAFASLKEELDGIADEYGIETTDLIVKKIDLSTNLDEDLQAKKKIDIAAYEIEKKADADAYRYQKISELAKLYNLPPEQVYRLLEYEAIKGLGSNAIVNVGGSTPIQPLYTMPMGENNNPQNGVGTQTTGDDQDQNTQGGRTR